MVIGKVYLAYSIK